MNIYQTIAAEYDRLFPHSQNKTDFVENRLTGEAQTILDLGCATGDLLISLHKPRRDLTGIDLEETMITMAKEKATKKGVPGIKFITADMTDHLRKTGPVRQDLLICFGNTLAYLADPAQLSDFLSNGYERLEPGGQFIIQIINFENPEIGAGFAFPNLETERILFSRSYSENTAGGLLFNIEVYQKESGLIQKDVHRLYPFSRSQIEDAAQKSRFKTCTVYGSYKGEQPRKDDFSRLFILEKE